MINLAFITVARSDFSRLLPIIKKVDESPDYHLHLIVGGNHTLDKFGHSKNEIDAQNLSIDCLSQGYEDGAKTSAQIMIDCAAYFAKREIDYLVILGDRFEMLAAAQAANLARVPIIHIGGGYKTEGAFDDAIRHAITQLSAIHLVATKECSKRVEGFSTDNSKIYLTGAPDLEIFKSIEALDRESFCHQVGLNPEDDFMLVTLHPETLSSAKENKENIREFEAFLLSTEMSILITAPCADPGSSEIFEMIERLKSKAGFVYKENLGGRLYVNALRQAALVVGNSSSGIIEAGSFAVPVINVGYRQAGREQNENVINCPFDRGVLEDSKVTALSEEFEPKITKPQNIYGDGHFSDHFFRVCENLK